MLVHIYHPQYICANRYIETDVHPEHSDECKEVMVVSRANAVIEPVAMMIKTVAASVAWATMLCLFVNVRITNGTFELKLLTFVGFTLLKHVSLGENCWVGAISDGCKTC